MSLAGSVSASLADPAGSSVIVAALWWLQATLLGTIATTVAVIAIASVGLMMMSGRVNVRHGFTVIMGSFILFGASSIVAGIQALGGADPRTTADAPPPMVAPPPDPPPAPTPRNPDPYAGAAVPTR